MAKEKQATTNLTMTEGKLRKFLEQIPSVKVPPANRYEKMNDLGVYVHCVERMEQISAIMKVYGENMTIKEVYDSVKYQLEKYKELVIGQ